jgi:hypothetical protein
MPSAWQASSTEEARRFVLPSNWSYLPAPPPARVAVPVPVPAECHGSGASIPVSVVDSGGEGVTERSSWGVGNNPVAPGVSGVRGADLGRPTRPPARAGVGRQDRGLQSRPAAMRALRLPGPGGRRSRRQPAPAALRLGQGRPAVLLVPRVADVGEAASAREGRSRPTARRTRGWQSGLLAVFAHQ